MTTPRIIVADEDADDQPRFSEMPEHHEAGWAISSAGPRTVAGRVVGF